MTRCRGARVQRRGNGVGYTDDYLLTGLLRSALRALACKSCACRPWQARSAGQRFTGPLPLSASPTPVRKIRIVRVACRRQYISRVSSRRTRNFGFGQSSQSHLRLRLGPQNQRVPFTPWSSRGVQARHFLRSRFPCSARKPGARRPVASPFDGMTVHWTLICFRLTPVPGLDARNPVRARSGPTSLSSLHCPAPLESPGLALRRWARRKAPKKAKNIQPTRLLTGRAGLKGKSLKRFFAS